MKASCFVPEMAKLGARLRFIVAGPGRGSLGPTTAIVVLMLDTGSEVSAIREGVLLSIGLVPERRARVRGFGAPSDKHHVYLADIALQTDDGASVDVGTFNVVGTAPGSTLRADGFIGRDVLRKCGPMVYDGGRSECVLYAPGARPPIV